MRTHRFGARSHPKIRGSKYGHIRTKNLSVQTGQEAGGSLFASPMMANHVCDKVNMTDGQSVPHASRNITKTEIRTRKLCVRISQNLLWRRARCDTDPRYISRDGTHHLQVKSTGARKSRWPWWPGSRKLWKYGHITYVSVFPPKSVLIA